MIRIDTNKVRCVNIKIVLFMPLIEVIMVKNAEKPIEILILAIPETAGSALYGMVDLLSAT